MRIDDSLKSVSEGSQGSAVAMRKLAITGRVSSGGDAWREMLGQGPDLSFLDLLTSLDSPVTPQTHTTRHVERKEKPKEAEKSEKSTIAKETTRTEAATNSASTSHDDSRLSGGDSWLEDPLDTELHIKAHQLTGMDQDYLRQALIPNLPILSGQVPAQSVFPAGEKGGISYRGFDISEGLAEMIKHGYKTGRPIRVELDNNSALVLKIRNGQVSAEFVAADQAAALAMQQDLNELRNKLAAKNLPVGTIESRYKQDARDDERRQSQDEREQNQ